MCKFEDRGIFLSEISSRGAKVPLKMHENIINFKALPIFFAQRGFMGIFKMSFLIPCRTKLHKKSFDINFFRVQPFSYQPTSERRIPNVNIFCRLFQRVCTDALTIAGLGHEACSLLLQNKVQGMRSVLHVQ